MYKLFEFIYMRVDELVRILCSQQQRQQIRIEMIVVAWLSLWQGLLSDSVVTLWGQRNIYNNNNNINVSQFSELVFAFVAL